jgi:hypothetical protein
MPGPTVTLMAFSWINLFIFSILNLGRNRFVPGARLSFNSWSTLIKWSQNRMVSDIAIPWSSTYCPYVAALDATNVNPDLPFSGAGKLGRYRNGPLQAQVASPREPLLD